MPCAVESLIVGDLIDDCREPSKRVRIAAYLIPKWHATLHQAHRRRRRRQRRRRGWNVTFARKAHEEGGVRWRKRERETDDGDASDQIEALSRSLLRRIMDRARRKNERWTDSRCVVFGACARDRGYRREREHNARYQMRTAICAATLAREPRLSRVSHRG